MKSTCFDFFFLHKFFFNSRREGIKATDRSKRYKLLVTISGIYSKVWEPVIDTRLPKPITDTQDSGITLSAILPIEKYSVSCNTCIKFFFRSKNNPFLENTQLLIFFSKKLQLRSYRILNLIYFNLINNHSIYLFILFNH